MLVDEYHWHTKSQVIKQHRIATDRNPFHPRLRVVRPSVRTGLCSRPLVHPSVRPHPSVQPSVRSSNRPSVLTRPSSRPAVRSRPDPSRPVRTRLIRPGPSGPSGRPSSIRHRQQSRAAALGCLRPTKSKTEAGVYKVLELYASTDALKAHGGTDYFKAAGAAMGPFMAGAPVIEYLDAVE